MSDTTVLGIILGMGAIAVVLLLAWIVLQIIADWKIFTKAGEAGWKSLIPIYNGYVEFRICWATKWFWISMVVGLATGIIQNFSEENGSTLLSLLFIVASIAVIVLQILQLNKLAKAFGYGVGFTLGLIFLNPIFKLILAFGSSEYIGPQE